MPFRLKGSWPGVAVGLLMLAPAGTWAQGKKVTFSTADGVELVGTYYAKPGGKRDTCVLLLHDFDPRKGGNSHQHGWDDLAKTLHKDEYAVLSFDFRGFGNSKSVARSFWLHPQNRVLPGARKRPDDRPAFIDQKDFPASYYPHLVDDVVAAKAFLDQENDNGQLNSSSVVVVGAGQGATIGALWMATQCQLKRNNNPNPFVPAVVLAAKPESQDIAAGVWLTISPRLAGRNVPVHTWLAEAGAKHMIPMVFIYGKKDEQGATYAGKLLDYIKRSTREDLKQTGQNAIPETELTGSALLNKRLDTEEWIHKKYINPVIEKRAARLKKDQKLKESSFYWVDRTGTRAQAVAKQAMVHDLIQPVPLRLFGIR
jgi:alpha-beta hydrolase superfamily lysophospholipase